MPDAPEVPTPEPAAAQPGDGAPRPPSAGAGADPRTPSTEAVHVGSATPPPSSALVLDDAGSRADLWRRRAMAVRARVPELARNPVVLAASATALTVAARVAADLLARAASGQGPARPTAVSVTGSVVHHLHVTHHVHVVHTSPPVVLRLPPTPPRP